MSFLHFSNPGNLYYLIPVSLAIAGGFWLKRLLSARFDEFFRGEAVLLSHLSWKNAWLKGGCLSSAFCVMILAAAGPVMQGNFHSYNVMALVDISQSMWCTDCRADGKPISRLELAKRSLLGLLDTLPPDSRFGLGVFAGERDSLFILASPRKVGRFYNDLRAMIGSIQYRWTWDEATNIEDTLSEMGHTLEKKRGAYGNGLTLIQLTDGENAPPGGVNMAVVDPRKFSGVNFYFAGFGTPEGGPVPEFDEQGNFKRNRQDQDGNSLITRLDEDHLKNLAEDLHGVYKHVQGSSDLKSVAKSAAYRDGEYTAQYNLSWAFWLGSFIMVVLFLIV